MSAASGAPICEHGTVVLRACHGADDPCLGEPLCPDCFDHEGAVIWNNPLGELWRRTTIYLPRMLAALTGMTQKRLHELVRVSYVKVAEYQRRGLVHLHAASGWTGDARLPRGRGSSAANRRSTPSCSRRLRATVARGRRAAPGRARRRPYALG